MSKKDQLENLGVFIGLRAAHEILIKVTNKPESKHHLEQEADTYSDLSFDLVKGHWNDGDIEMVKELSKKKCHNKLERYKDINDEKYKLIEDIINGIMVDLGLV